MTPLPTIRGFRSGIINALSARVREQRPVAGPGLIVTPGPGGTAISLARSTSSASGSDSTPWAPTISDTTLTITNPIYLRSPKYTIPATLTFSLAASDGDGDYYCGVKISVIDGTIDSTLLISKTLANVVYTSLAAANADADYMRLLVCIVTYDETAATFTLKLRCITSVPELGLYAS
jgi:hypothetical protein